VGFCVVARSSNQGVPEPQTGERAIGIDSHAFLFFHSDIVSLVRTTTTISL
jgi:hypothetical protein